MTAPRPMSRWSVALALAAALAIVAPTVGDFGLTYDEPAYRYSQLVSVQWWEELARARSRADLSRLLDPTRLLYYWPYGRHGINFHPPLAGQSNLLAYALFGRWLGDIPARRLAPAIELSLTAALLFNFVGRRYGLWAGLGAMGALLLMPRVYGQAHLIDTDTPGLLIGMAAAFAYWKGVEEPNGRRSRMAFGILAGLAFLTKMAAIAFLVPIVAWLVLAHLVPALRRPRREDWIDGLLTTALLLTPLMIAFLEILRLAKQFPPPQYADLFLVRPTTPLPGAILLAPLALGLARHALVRKGWIAERPALEAWAALLAFAPVVGWLGNPAWWRETLPRLAHYYTLNASREGALAPIHIIYFGKIYTFSLPPSNGWVLIALTVPASLLAAAALGLAFARWSWVRRDRFPLFVLLNLVTMPLLRMLPTPAHDGVRLMLPTFGFLAIPCGWGINCLGVGLARLIPAPSPAPVQVPGAPTTALLATAHVLPGYTPPRPQSRIIATAAHLLATALFLAPAAWQLIRIHPYELSYYNELIGGPRGAWRRGMELTYWYDAFTPQVFRDLNARFPEGAEVTFANKLSAPMTFGELQSLGALRKDLVLGHRDRDRLPFTWLLTHDSKAEPRTRLLFQMTPWYVSRPRQLDRLPVLVVADPTASYRAIALELLAGGPERRRKEDPPNRLPRPTADAKMLRWAKTDPRGLLAAATAVAADGPLDARAQTLRRHLERPRDGAAWTATLLEQRPDSLVEAARILVAHPEQVRVTLEREGFTDPTDLGGYLDRDLDHPPAGAVRESPLPPSRPRGEAGRQAAG